MYHLLNPQTKAKGDNYPLTMMSKCAGFGHNRQINFHNYIYRKFWSEMTDFKFSSRVQKKY